MEEQVSIKQVAVKYGLIMGLIGILQTLVTYIMHLESENTLMSIVGGVITIVLLVLAHKEFKEKGNGFMSFGEGFKIGFFAILISSIMSAIFVVIYISMDASVVERILEAQMIELENQGMSDEQIDAGIEMTRKFMSPAMMGVYALLGGAIIGAIIAALVSLFTKKQNPELEI